MRATILIRWDKGGSSVRADQFGATFGGPVVIPGIYDGRGRTFFFVDYEGFRVRQAQTQTAFVPPTEVADGKFLESD